jgi:hypothetical protein
LSAQQCAELVIFFGAGVGWQAGFWLLGRVITRL